MKLTVVLEPFPNQEEGDQAAGAYPKMVQEGVPEDQAIGLAKAFSTGEGNENHVILFDNEDGETQALAIDTSRVVAIGVGSED